MEEFNAHRCKAQVDKAVDQIRMILENTRKPVLASDVAHRYVDKYLLVEFITSSTIVCLINTLESMGITMEQLKTMKEWTKNNRSATIRFKGKETCSFLHKKEKTRQSGSGVEITGLWSKITGRTITKYTEYTWKFSSQFELFCFQGNEVNEPLPIVSREGTTNRVTTSEESPALEVRVIEPIDLNITWLLQQIDDNMNVCFLVDREDPKCKTPRRNADIDKAYEFLTQLYIWSSSLLNHFDTHSRYDSHNSYDPITDDNIFIPILPIFEIKQQNQPKQEEEKEEKQNDGSNKNSNKKENEINTISSVHLQDDIENSNLFFNSNDINEIVLQQKKNLIERANRLKKQYSNEKLNSSTEVVVMLSLKHYLTICQKYSDGIDYVEDMLRNQLISAIGKEITDKEFDEYMRYHFRKIFKADYEPKLFCYAIRRPDHYPEGFISIETTSKDSQDEAIPTMVKRVEAFGAKMKFPISAATKINFTCEKYIHAFISHQFSNQTEIQDSLKVIGRARQFSCFILMIGNVISADEFLPSSAIIIKNKDDLLIPLLTEVIPTPKAFAKSIESLSENQRAFAKAFRSMQLESTLFSMCIIQIKPHLEQVLNLPDDSLTKEIRLTQDLFELFMEYQIPSSLLSFEGEPGITYSVHQKIDQVKSHVRSIKSMIDDAKKQEIDDAKALSDLNKIITEISSESDGSEDECDEDECEEILMPQRDECKYSRQSSLLDYCSSDVGGGGGAYTNSLGDTRIEFADFDDCRLYSEPPGGSVAKKSAKKPKSKAVKQKKESKLKDKAVKSKATKSKQDSKPASKPAPKSEELKKQEDVDDVPAEENQKIEREEIKEEQKEEQKEEEKEYNRNKAVGSSFEDVTKLPEILNEKFDELDRDDSLHATILKPGTNWTRKFQKGILGTPSSEDLNEDTQRIEQNRAFDLLDALSRSGGLTLHGSLHVVVAATHCFDKTLINTVVQDNVNPIGKVERSALIVSSTIHEESPDVMLNEEHLQRIKQSADCAHLF